MSISGPIKSSPWKFILGLSSPIVVIIGALFALDSRYAHAEDVKRDKIEIQRTIEGTSQTLRKQMLEDKIFELDVKNAQLKDAPVSPIDVALRARYQRQLDEIVKK